MRQHGVDHVASVGPEPLAHRDRLHPYLRSILADAAATVALRADLHELAADLFDLDASVHELSAQEHVNAFLARVGDPVLHRDAHHGHLALAAIQRGSAKAARLCAAEDRRAAERYNELL